MAVDSHRIRWFAEDTTLTRNPGTWAVAALALATPTHLSAWELAGRVDLHAESAKLSGSELAQGTVIFFEPEHGPSPQTSTDVFEITMQRKEFLPRVLAVPTGSSVRFPNRDPILHNVFSVSAPGKFDLGLYRADEGKSVLLGEPGLVRAFCNVHHSMVAYILVLDTPHVTRPATDGSFTLDGLPDGGGTLTVWNERAEPFVTEVGPEAPPQSIELQLDKTLVPRHANKFGKPYARERRRAY